MHLHFGHLYPATMSTYGDTGNLLCLIRRATWRGIQVTVHGLEVGTPIPSDIHFYFFGGGQDAAQSALGEDLLQKKASRILLDAAAGVPVLAICGGYQLLGRSYKPFDAPAIPGVGLFPVETVASHDRMIGNLIVNPNASLGFLEKSATIVGFENHSGKTTIVDPSKGQPLGYVVYGSGNNGDDKTEGCITGHAIGCYMHGSLLPKNPHLADWILEKACQRLNPNYQLPPLDDRLEWETHHTIVGRYI